MRGERVRLTTKTPMAGKTPGHRVKISAWETRIQFTTTLVPRPTREYKSMMSELYMRMQP